MIKNDVQLSQDFKMQTTKAITAIAVFIIVYLCILLFAVLLTIACIYAGILLIVEVPRFFTIALGIGLASLGIFILIFVVKFLFKKTTIDRSHLTELTEQEQPELYATIRQIVSEVGTSFPKKIYISPEVNASVFYDASFWSMFLPVQKNLVIGLGLVNTIHEEELKAILAHEFGHFSQRTMKVGSYVYHANQIIYNMLHDNESYDQLLQQWANASGYFGIFVVIAVKIIEMIQWIFLQLYGFMNRSYLSLSREMEFHADEIAAHVTGTKPLRSALLRMNLADHSFNATLNFYDPSMAANTISTNVFKEQRFVMHFFATEDQLPMVAELPAVDTAYIDRYNTSKLVIRDQWASHPSVQERIARLEKMQVAETTTTPRLASALFNTYDQLEERMTQQLFTNVQYSETPTPLSFEAFREGFVADFKSETFAKVFNGYYDIKTPIHFDPSALTPVVTSDSFEDLFSTEKNTWIYTANALENDIAILKQIANKELAIKSFDYDGTKYKYTAALSLSETLAKELTDVQERIKANDLAIYHYFYQLEQQTTTSPQLQTLYTNLFAHDAVYEQQIGIYNDIYVQLEFIANTTPFDTIRANFRALIPKENLLKTYITELLEDSQYADEITPTIQTNLESYTAKSLHYFEGEKYHNEHLEILFTALHTYARLVSKGYFTKKKQLLSYKESLLNSKN